LLLLLSNTTFGQDGITPVATVKYDVQKIVTFGIPDQVNLSELDDYDIATIRPYAKQHAVSKSLFSNGNVETTCIYPQGKGNPDTWIKPIYRSVSDCFGVKFYDATDVEIYRRQFDTPGTPEPLDANGIAGFGYVQPIKAPTTENLSAIVASGFQVQAKSDGTYVLWNATTTIFIDPIKQTYQTRITQDGALLSDEKVTIVQLANGKYVVGALENKTLHRTLKGNFYIEETEVETYSNFRRDQLNIGSAALQASNNTSLPVLGEKVTYAYQVTDDTRDVLTVGPIPTEGIVNVKLESRTNSTNSLELLDLSGKVIANYGVIVPQQQLVVDLSNVAAGTYLLRASNPSFSLYQKIVKF
jgi:hypothetical protein